MKLILCLIDSLRQQDKPDCNWLAGFDAAASIPCAGTFATYSVLAATHPGSGFKPTIIKTRIGAFAHAGDGLHDASE
jgi:hypothetical protein